MCKAMMLYIILTKRKTWRMPFFPPVLSVSVQLRLIGRGRGSDAQVPESEFDAIKQQIVEMTSSSSRSTRPAIYGIVAAAEVERLRPVTGSPTSQSDVSTLELAAAEMAQVG